MNHDKNILHAFSYKKSKLWLRIIHKCNVWSLLPNSYSWKGVKTIKLNNLCLKLIEI